jgi:cytidyltransferase-like protein
MEDARSSALPAPVEPFVVYVDMVGDLFHAGHVSFLRKVRAVAEERAPGRPVHLLVGLMADADAARYKRRPILSLEERRVVVSACRYVDEVVAPCPEAVTDELLDHHRVGLVVHGDDFDETALERWYAPAQRRGILATVPYSQVAGTDVSTSAIIARLRTLAS